MSLLALESALIQHLQAALPDLTVEPFPDRPDDYSLLNPLGAALVNLPGGQYSVPVGGVQRRTRRVVITLLCRGLSGHAGLYVHLDTAIAALAGWCPGEPWDELVLLSDDYVTQRDGVWQQDIVFEVNSRLVSQYNACGSN